MLVLSLDTSADIAVAVVETTLPAAASGHALSAAGPAGPAPAAGVRALAAERSTEQRRHAELLAPMVQTVLDRAGLDRRDLTAVVVGTGPAPFTGLRAGLVTARTLGFALGIPVHGVCSLDGLAAQAFDALGANLATGAQISVVTDARRREVYVARYRRGPWSGAAGDVERVGGPAVVRPGVLAAELGSDDTVVGPGAALYPEHLVAADGAPTSLDPAVLARLAVLRTADGSTLSTEPLYLRRPDVAPASGGKRATG